MSISSRTPKNSNKTSSPFASLTRKEQKLYSSIKPLLTESNTKLCRRVNTFQGKSQFSSKANTSRGSVKNIKIRRDLTMRNDDLSELSTLQEIRLNFLPSKENLSAQTVLRGDKKIQPEFNIPQELLCYLCLKLIEEPVKCYKCNTRFCKKCLTEVVNIKQKCPKCFCLISDNLIQPVDLTKEYEKKIIQCPYPGCKEDFNLLVVKEHMKKCVFKDAYEEQRAKVNKFVSYSYEKDPYIKPHLLLLLKKNKAREINNATTFVYNDEEQKKRFEISNNNYNNTDFDDMLKEMRKRITEANDSIENNIFDIAKATKDTNDTIKKVLKN